MEYTFGLVTEGLSNWTTRQIEISQEDERAENRLRFQTNVLRKEISGTVSSNGAFEDIVDEEF